MRYFDKTQVGGGGSAGSKDSKPIPIPQYLLDRLKNITDPVKKPVIPHEPKRERMQKASFDSLKACLLSNEREVAEKSVVFLEENAQKLHSDDLSDLIKATLSGEYAYTGLLTTPLVNILPESYHSELYERSIIMIETTMKSEYNTCFVAIPFIKDLPKKYQPKLYDQASEIIKTALNHNNDAVQRGAIPFIKYLPESRQPEFYMLAGEIIKAAMNSRLDYISRDASPLIHDMPVEFKPDLIRAALNSKQLPVAHAAIAFINELPFEVRPGLIKAALTYWNIDVCIAAVRIINDMPPEHRADLFKIALNHQLNTVRCAVIPNIKKLPGSCQQDLYLIASEAIRIAFDGIDGSFKHYTGLSCEADLINEMPRSYWPKLIGAALNSTYEFHRKAVFPFIKDVPFEFQPNLIKISLEKCLSTRFEAVGLIAKLPEGHRADLIKIVLNTYFGGNQTIGIQLIKDLPKSYWPGLVEAALSSKFWEVQQAAIPLILEVPEAHRQGLIKIALNLEHYLAKLMTTPLIKEMPAYSQHDYYSRANKQISHTLSGISYEQAVPFIRELPENYRPKLYYVASKKIKASLENEFMRIQLEAIPYIAYLPKEYWSDLIRIARISKYGEVREAAQKLQK